MNTILKIIKYELRDVIRSKWILIYFAFLFMITEGMFQFSGSSSKVLLSMINIVLILIPIITISYGIIYMYSSREFTEMLLAQPINRKTLFTGLYSGLALPLSIAYIVGIGIPFIFHGVEENTQIPILSILLLSGIALTFVFTSLAVLISLSSDDKVKGLGIGIFVWLFMAVVYDGALLFGSYLLSEYPLEKPMVGMTMLNPIDLARVLLMLKFDISALMGYTGAIFKKFFGSPIGMLFSTAMLLLWIIVPYQIAKRIFVRKDF
ncbi:MAG: ABC transporter permease subunit [Ignavibacteriae bacterium]|nr:ABC transporter permease subunit [Ignavibacteriota bacterium]